MSQQIESPEGRPNYNWHPQVHANVGEALWFFLVRFKDPTAATVEDQMQAILTRTGIRHACEYTLYGYWDGLIRVWMTDSLKRRFLRIIKNEADELGLEETRYFEASGLYYMWHDPATDLLEDGPGIGQLNKFEEDIRTAEGDVDRVPDPSKLMGDGLLIKRPEWPERGVKLYVSLEYTATSSLVQEHEVTQLRRAVKNAGLDDRCSLYVGHGFARYLLRCVVDDFSLVLDLMQKFYLELRDLYRSGLALRPMTFVIMQASVESDNLNFFGALSGQDEATAERLDLGSTGRSLFAGMTQDERTHIHDLVVRIDELSFDDERLNARLNGLIRACIEEDVDEVVTSLTFVVDLEWLFRAYMLPLWAAHYEGDWRKPLIEQAEAIKPEEDWTVAAATSPSEWTFGLLHKLAEVSGRENASIQAALVRDLGEGWHGRIHALVDLRNFAAHSKARAVEHVSDLEGAWGRRVEEVINCTEIYFLFKRLTKERSYSVGAN